MSKTELNENKAIASVVARKESTGYRKAIEANIPVTYLSRSTVVRVLNGKRTAIEQICVSKHLKTPKVYSLK